ncbi:hypothetical protein LTR95_003472, partial [Oleoguttula sp. CCFEE 5521]
MHELVLEIVIEYSFEPDDERLIVPADDLSVFLELGGVTGGRCRLPQALYLSCGDSFHIGDAEGGSKPDLELGKSIRTSGGRRCPGFQRGAGS